MVRVHLDPPVRAWALEPGAIAQLGEHLLCKQGVVGSIPTGSTRADERRITLRIQVNETSEHQAESTGCRLSLRLWMSRTVRRNDGLVDRTEAVFFKK